MRHASSRHVLHPSGPMPGASPPTSPTHISSELWHPCVPLPLSAKREQPKKIEDFCLNLRNKIWSCLSHMCRVRSNLVLSVLCVPSSLDREAQYGLSHFQCKSLYNLLICLLRDRQVQAPPRWTRAFGLSNFPPLWKVDKAARKVDKGALPPECAARDAVALLCSSAVAQGARLEKERERERKRMSEKENER